MGWKTCVVLAVAAYIAYKSVDTFDPGMQTNEWCKVILKIKKGLTEQVNVGGVLKL